MPRARLLAAALAATIAAAVPGTARAAGEATAGFDPTPVPPAVEPLQPGAPAPCGQGSWVAGSVEVCAGEVVYRDYVYDDFGAAQMSAPPPELDVLGLQPSIFPQGDAYGFLPPSGARQQGLAEHEKNTTDLVAVRLRRGAGGTVAADVELNTLFDPSTTRVVLAVDRDADATTGGGPLPGLVADPDSATPASVAGWDGPLVELACDAGTNRCTGSFPSPAGEFRVWALAARAADGTVMNVAFRGLDETGFWWESRQAVALQGGDLTAYALDVAPADLDPATTRRFETPRGRVLQRVYVSEHPVGEGVSDDGVPGPAYAADNQLAAAVSQAFNLLGRYQPYGFYLPAAPGPHGVQLTMHGLAENHSARLYFPTTDGSFATNVGEARNRVLVTVLGRGWKNWYSSYGERDAWDALADAIANYDIDPTQRFVSGYSMGGYGTLRLGALFPDVWAGALNWVGYTGDLFNGTPLVGLFGGQASGASVGAFGNTMDLLANLRHVPMAGVYGAADELVHVNQAVTLQAELARLLVPSIVWLHPTGEHVSPMLADDWTKESDWSAGRSLVRDPVTVTFRTDERFFLPELGLVPDHAYWVRAIDPASPGYADVEARSAGCGGTEPVHEVRHGAGPLDPPPLLGSAYQEVAEVARTPVPAEQRLDLTVANIASLAIDTGAGTSGACLADGPVAYSLTTDGPVTVRLTDGRTLTAPAAGTYEGTLPPVAVLADTAPPPAAPTGATATAAAAAPSALARTGLPVPLLAAASLAAVSVGARALRLRAEPAGRRRYRP